MRLDHKPKMTYGRRHPASAEAGLKGFPSPLYACRVFSVPFVIGVSNWHNAFFSMLLVNLYPCKLSEGALQG